MTMEREIGSNDIEVSGAPSPIENKTYKHKNTKMMIRNIWLKLMNIPDRQKIISEELVGKKSYYFELVKNQLELNKK